MLGVFLLGNFLLKLPVSLSMVAGAVAGTLAAGDGIPLRHLFEGTFVYLDTVLIIATAMIFMTVVPGVRDPRRPRRGNRFPVLQSAGGYACAFDDHRNVPRHGDRFLHRLGAFGRRDRRSDPSADGLPAPTAGAFLAIGAVLGMAAPPVNIPAMLITGGVDMPYIGFEGPLFTLTIGSGVIAALFLGLRHCKNLDYRVIGRAA